MKISKLNQRNTQINIKPIVTREEADQYSYENIIGDSKMLSESVYGIIVYRHFPSSFSRLILRESPPA